MSRIENGEVYLDTDETRIVFDNASKGRFHNSIRDRLTRYRFGGKVKPWYREAEVLALKEGKQIRKADIPLSGIFKDWTAYLSSLNYQSETKDTQIEITTLPEDVIEIFHLPADKQVVKRERMSYANGAPICVWSTYYPVDLIENMIGPMKAGKAGDLVKYIKKNHGLAVGKTRDRYSARETTFEEMDRFQLRKEETVIILRRASYTEERKFLFFSDMVLLANWFVIDEERDVDIWDNE
jgi:DNA-binding GntR family transcriptional regulator